MRRSAIAPPLLAALLAAGACSPLLTADESRDAVHGGFVTRNGDLVIGTGTVLWYGLEGGFFAIRGDDGKVYDPVNLPATFARDGMKVRFTAKVRRDMGSIHMVGEMVEIQQITGA